jgi:outer membrane protein assembly factor BamE (lipoprotein component of BamABCDE complex)
MIFRLLIVVLVMGCTPGIVTRGHFVDEDMVKKLTVGKQGKTDVLLLLGSPSTTSTFDKNIWFYIGQKTQKVAFFTPDVVAHQVVALSFNPTTEVLDALVLKGMDDKKDLTPIRESTPTAGKRLTVLEQLVGNLGKWKSGNNPAP